MPLVEPLEPRRLFAVTPDVTFADNGRLAFSLDYSVENVLATQGEIYVQAYQNARGRTVILKYTDAGVLDTRWGRGGYVVPRRFADLPSNRALDNLTLVRDNRTGGLLVGSIDHPATAVAVDRYAADGSLDTAWGSAGRVADSEPKTYFTLPRLIALPHKRVLLAIGREQQRGDASNNTLARGGADDVAVLKFDSLGRYDRAFNGGHALTVAGGNYRQTYTVVDDLNTKRVEDYTVPTFGDVQFFADGRLRVVSTREETHQTTSTYNTDVITTVGRSVLSAESTVVTPDGRVLAKRSASYVLKRVVIADKVADGTDQYTPEAAAASADGAGIAVLGETLSAAGVAQGGSLLRVGPGYRSRPEPLPGVLGTRYLGGVSRSGDGTILAQSDGTGDFFDPDDNTIGFGPGVLDLGRDLAVGRHRVVLPPTYFPESSFDVLTSDDQGRLLIEGTNLDTDTFDLIRYV